MSLKALFKAAVATLQKRNVPFAVAGGLAADLYRREPRLTMDVDLVILTDDRAVETAKAVIEAVGLRAGIIRRADLDGGPLFAVKQKSTKPCMVVGRKTGDSSGEGVDILLPEIPWVADAVRRATNNLVDYGFGPVPALTVEDVIIAKLFALQSADMRAKDLDDLQSIFAAEPTLNVPYLAGQIDRLHLEIKKTTRPFLPAGLIDITRDIARARKSIQEPGA
ncbi:MAG TPA: nucleotidyl transferase AbiEii/AbiGii toxin family protein [Kiritimatiellia bacterium]|nr:nucleotidyl transferase AbiEii/AbiGii toxin family protein [Kiritimatiellia bacterium]HMO98343.1 nucleotidyl transferase AbiEii/AbiGii toxin family protein [Kiritimatiellia bacterium]HMP95461.1 nucleotidyl transferase AbiEii/AbiGii toxin family protein [Kiritimatiellia bacterium]